MSKRPREEIDSIDEDERKASHALSSMQNEIAKPNRRRCPYLDTVNRQYLDFDNEKVCSVTLSNINVYACLVCGKFFQGRGKTSVAYTHSVQCGHFVFMNLHDGRAYCLPDSYEIIDTSLDDVKKCLSPSYSPQAIVALDENTSLARDVYGVAYLPGFVGLNNLKATDYINVSLHALAHIPCIRDFFLVASNFSHCKSRLVHSFATVIAKIWSSDNFKSVVSPQEFVQEVTIASKKRFSIETRSECTEFFVWLLQELSRDIYGKTKRGKTFLDDLQGEVEVTTFVKKSKNIESNDATEPSDESYESTEAAEDGWIGSTAVTSFLFLSIDIPPCPLFRDSQGGAVIPQIPIFEILKKFDGETVTDHITTKQGHCRKKYRITKLPKNLILHLNRFTKNNFSTEKNPTIITFPVKNFEMRDYFQPNPARSNDDRAMTEGSTPTSLSKYDLVSNICHDSLPATQGVAIGSSTILSAEVFEKPAAGAVAEKGPLANGSYRIHLQHKATKQWYEIQDLRVAETIPQLVGLSESCMLIYERKTA